MSSSDRTVEDAIIRVLDHLQEPSDPEIVFNEVRKASQDIDNTAIRNAVWRLISRDKVELTPKLQLKSKNSTLVQNSLNHSPVY